MEEINFIRPEEVYNRNTGESKVRYRSYDGNDRFIPVVEGKDGVPKTLTKVTWQELKDKRDASKLTPGALYRITDYNCTTTQENTQSAGHQFDIVLLALSANKLAEEGWAMMNESNIYDVTFNDGIIKKCYWYPINESYANLVDVETLIGVSGVEVIGGEVHVDEINKTIDTSNIETGYASTELTEENLTYNYFQNSKLEAWKVWYCLDNDISRFAWADEENGKGVIYRLIDEFNNDVAYDFKNIQFVRKLTDGQYDADNGTNTWCYTLNVWYNDMCQDASIVGNTLPNDEGFVAGVYDNNFGYATAYDLNFESGNTIAFALGNNVILSLDEGDGYFGINSNIIGNDFYNNTIGTNFNFNIIGNEFYNNIIRNSFQRNIIGNEFFRNKVGNNFYSNSIGNYFGGNTISDDTSYKNYGNNGVELATKDDLNP